MDVMLQRHGAKRVYAVPERLRELCTDISREVLRSQPTNLYQFIADYLDAILHTRETARVAARILSDILDQTETYEAAWKSRGLTMGEVTNAATIIQAAFRGYATRKSLESLELEIQPSVIDDIITKCGVDTDTANRACTIIQSFYRGHQVRKMYKAHKVTDDIITNCGVDTDTANRACTIIQSVFRGHQARKIYKAQKATCSILLECGTDAELANKACTIIQAAYRGHLVRKYLSTHTVKKETNEAEAYLNKILQDMDVAWDEVNAAATRIQRMFRKVRSMLEVQEKPPGEPQVRKRRPRNLLETKDTTEALAGPLGLTQGEVKQFAEDIVDSMISEAPHSDVEEGVEVAGCIVDTVVINALQN